MADLKAKTLAPAKVNLSLRVLRRRADGYHDIDSVVVPVSLYDSVEIQATRLRAGPSRLSLECDSAAIPEGAQNLAWRAAELFVQETGIAASLHLTVHKRIPAGSGLGGGSSDAAAVLVLLNRLFDTPLRRPALLSLGARLGADVPFFIVGRPARITGLGEKVKPLPAPPDWPLVLCSDGFSMSTAAVYSRVRLSLTKSPRTTNIRSFVSGRKPISELLVNDLEAAAAEIHADVLRLKNRLFELGAQGALMTGSGSVVFGVWPEAGSARAVARTLGDEGLWAEAVCTLAATPLAEE